ncbi:hypothetical protein [Streptomyces sp. NPDC053367]|uniref:hypothetical protein n=1 Tax=Streptomyces sp. NPDC053367 TaxID=3365700 RepID=UPI0037CFDC95
MGFDIYLQANGERLAEGEPTYLGLTTSQMARITDAMKNFGMLVELSPPVYPTLATYGLSRADFHPDVRHDPATTNRIAEYRAAYQAVKEAADPHPRGIPSYKVAFSAGYLITPAEITAALTTYEAHPHVDIAEMPVGDPTWRNWVAFLRRAQAHGGLRVR